MTPINHLFLLTIFALSAGADLVGKTLQQRIADDLPRLSKSLTGDCSPGIYPDRPIKWTYDVPPAQKVSWRRIHFTMLPYAGAEGASLIFRTFKGELLQTFSLSAHQNQVEQWTMLFSADTVLVDLISQSPVNGLRVCIDRINIPTEPGKISAVVGKDNRVALVRSMRWYEFGRSVVLIRFQEPDGVETNCTGVFVASSIVATNNHCINEKTNLRTATVTVGHEQRSNLQLADEQTIAVAELLATSLPLDYSFIRVDGEAKAIARIANSPSLKKNTPLIVIQHPDASIKEISVRDCKVETSRVDYRQSDFFHLCDTSGGSSGSPIMSEANGEVFGLHHLETSKAGPDHYHNLGIYFSAILADLQSQNPVVRAMLKDVVESQDGR